MLETSDMMPSRASKQTMYLRSQMKRFRAIVNRKCFSVPGLSVDPKIVAE